MPPVYAHPSTTVGPETGAEEPAPPAPDPKEPVGCRFIHGNVPGLRWRYCQKPQRPGSMYCPEHHARCIVTPEQAVVLWRALVTALLRNGTP